MRKQKQSKCSVFYFLAKLYKGLISENKLLRSIVLIDNIFDVFCKGNYKLYIRGYSPLFPNLITKESYNWWVTRRFWGFRQQISKTKYLKISQNVGRKYLEASREHRSTVQNNISKCRWHMSGSFKGSGYIQREKLKRLPLLSGVIIPDVNIRVECGGNRV